MSVVRWLLVSLMVVSPICALAQSPPQPSTFAHRWEVTGAIGYATGSELAEADANLRANSPAAQPYALFTTTSRFAGATLWEARVGYVLSRRVDLEARLGFGQPDLATSVRADAEGAAPITVVERVDQFVIDGGVIVRIDEVRVGGLVPYAAAGAGYLRQLHEGLTVIEQGHVYHLGGGVKRNLVTRTHGIVRAAGLRVDARMYFLSGGISVDDRTLRQGSFTAGLFARF